LLREVPGPGGAEAVVDAVADAREAVQLMGGEGVEDEVADGLEVPGRGRGYLGLTGAGEGGVARVPGAWAALPGVGVHGAVSLDASQVKEQVGG
jgi:hypothetical protein